MNLFMDRLGLVQGDFKGLFALLIYIPGHGADERNGPYHPGHQPDQVDSVQGG